MKKILIPTDFSDCARAAEDYAIALARKSGAELHFIHAVYTPVEWVNLPLDKEQLYPEVKAAIGAARHTLDLLCKRAEEAGLKAKSALAYNRGREEILHYVSTHNIDLVVMGSHGAEGIKEVLGTNAQLLVRYAPIPVLVVKKGAIAGSISKMLFATTFEPESIPCFEKAKAIASLLGAHLYLLYINTPYGFRETAETEKQSASFLSAAGERGMPYHTIEALNEERGIVAFAKKHSIDMVAVATRKRGDLSRLVFPGLTEALVNHTQMPVLSIK